MKIAISTTCGKEYLELIDITSPINRDYAFAHGYEFNIHYCEYTNGISYHNANLHYVYSSLPHYDMIMTIDADAIITNHKISIESIIPEEYDQQIAKEKIGGSIINNGVMIWRNRQSTYELLNDILCTKKTLNKTPWNWQGYICNLITSKSELLNKMNIVEPKIMNSFGCDIENKIHWTSGDFIAHLFMAPIEEKIKLSRRIVEMVVK